MHCVEDDCSGAPDGELMPGLRFRRLEPSSLDAIYGIELSSFPYPWSRGSIAEEFRQPIAHSLGLFLGTELIGYCISHLVVDEFHILSFAVHPDQRRKGYGAILLYQCLKYAVEHGAVYACLEVRAGNLEARRLYEKCGFGLRTVRKEYYANNREDALVLDRTLSGENFIE